MKGEVGGALLAEETGGDRGVGRGVRGAAPRGLTEQSHDPPLSDLTRLGGGSDTTATSPSLSSDESVRSTMAAMVAP